MRPYAWNCVGKMAAQREQNKKRTTNNLPENTAQIFMSIFSSTRGQLINNLEATIRRLEQADILMDLSSDEIDCEFDAAWYLYNRLLEANVRVAGTDVNRAALFANTAGNYMVRINQAHHGISMVQLTMEAEALRLAGSEATPVATIDDEIAAESSMAIFPEVAQGGEANREPMTETEMPEALEITSGSAPLGDIASADQAGATGGEIDGTENTVSDIGDEILSQINASRVPMFSGPTYNAPISMRRRTYEYMRSRPLSAMFADLSERETTQWVSEGVMSSPANADGPARTAPVQPSVTSPPENDMQANDPPVAPPQETDANAQMILGGGQAMAAPQAVAAPMEAPVELDRAIDIAVSPYRHAPAHFQVMEYRYPRCQHCGLHGHSIIRCLHFATLTVEERIARVTELQLCINCFRRHNVRECRLPGCPRCRAQHNSLLCKVNPK